MLIMQQQQLARKLFVSFLVALSCFPLPGLAQPPELPQEEGEFSCSYICVYLCMQAYTYIPSWDVQGLIHA